MALIHRGNVAAGEKLGSGLDFWTVVVSAGGDLTEAAVLNKVVDVISLNGQPVIMGVPTSTTLKFAIEHVGAWSKSTLESALSTHAGITATATLAESL